MFGQANDTFNLSVSTQSVKQGDMKEVTVGIKRGTNFDQDVGLRFVDLPAGVTVTPEGAALKHGDEESKFTLKAADDAAPGTFTVRVTSRPKAGADATREFKFSVAKR